MINQVSFKNYKIFKEKQTLEIKPLTILIGKNNTGKSAILKLMTLLEGALNGQSEKVLELNLHDNKIGNEYKDLIYGKFGRPLDLEIIDVKDGIESMLRTRIIVDINKDIPIIEDWKFITLENDKLNDLSIYKSDKFYIDNKDGSEYNCSFKGIWLTDYNTIEVKNTTDSSKKPFLFTDFIGAIRDKAKLDYRLSLESEKSNIDGKFLYDFLIRDYLTTEKIYFNKISSWISENFEGWNLYIDVDSEPYHIQLRKGSLEIDLTETGMGICQSLPLIIRAHKPCKQDTLIIIEEPEAHLHPFAHAHLAQLFFDSIKEDRNKRYLIETHSENFILRLRKLIADKNFNFNPDDIRLYYIDYNEEKNESNLKPIQIDIEGNVEWWPDGVFEEGLNEVIEIRKAQNS